MKKAVLYGATALAGVALMAAPQPAEASSFEVGVGGFMSQWIGFADNDDSAANTDPQDIQQFSDVEIHINPELTMDNGITAGAVIELMGDNNELGREADQHFGYLEGQFGRLELGATNSPAYKMHVIAPNVGMPINNGHVDEVFTGLPAPVVLDRTTLGGTFQEPGADDAGNKVAFFTPSFNGFMLGASYQPDINTPESVIANEDTAFVNGVTVGGAYNGEYQNTLIDASGGFYWADDGDQGGTDEYLGFTGGLGLGYNMGTEANQQVVTVGGSISYVDSPAPEDGEAPVVALNGGTSLEGFAWDAGISYETNAWGASFTYQEGDQDAAGGDPDLQIFAVGGEYKLAQGVSLNASVGYADLEVGGAEVNDGVFGVGGVNMSF